MNNPEFGFTIVTKSAGTDAIERVKSSFKDLAEESKKAGESSTEGVRKLIDVFAQSKRAAAGLNSEFINATVAVTAAHAKLKASEGDATLANEFVSLKSAARLAKEELQSSNLVSEMARRELAAQGVNVASLAEDYRKLKIAQSMAQHQPSSAPNSAMPSKNTMGISTPATSVQPNVHQAGSQLDEVSLRIDAISQKMANMGHIASLAFVGQYVSGYAAELGHLSDKYTSLNAQLRLSVGETGNYAQAQADVHRIATNTATGLSETSQLYSRLSSSVMRLGFDQAQVAKVTETVGLSLKVSGATAAESSSAILQLSQAFGSGVLRGEEFNAVNEASPRLMQALADSIGKPREELRTMAEHGQLTAKLLATALPSALDTLKKESASMPLTIGQSFTLLNNEMTLMVGRVNNATGMFNSFASGVKLIANNLEVAFVIAGTVAAASSVKIIQGIAAKRAVERAAHIAALAEIAERTTAESLANQAAMTGLAKLGAARATSTAAAISGNTAAIASNVAVGVSMRTMLTFLTGPVGIILSIGAAAAAWVGFKNNAVNALDTAIAKEKELKEAQDKTKIKTPEGLDADVLELNQFESLLAGKRATYNDAKAKFAASAKEPLSLSKLLFGQSGLELAGLRTGLADAEAIVAKKRSEIENKGAESEKRQAAIKQALEDGKKPPKIPKAHHAAQSDPLQSGIDSIIADNSRAKMQASGETAATAASELKLYELAIKGIDAATKLDAEGKHAAAAAMRDHTAAAVAAARITTDETEATKAATLAKQAPNKATDDATKFIDKMNQSAALALENQAFANELDGKGEVETARLTAERRAYLDTNQQIYELNMKYKDNPAAADAAIKQVLENSPAQQAAAGTTAAAGATKKLVDQVDQAGSGAENDRYAQQLEAQNAYFAAGESSAAEHARTMQAIEKDHATKSFKLMMDGKMSQQNFAKLDVATRNAIVLQGAEVMLGAMAGHNKKAFEANKAYSTGKAIISTYEAVAGSLAMYPGPPGWAIAGAQLAMGLAQVSAIQSASFGGGSSGGGAPSAPSAPPPQSPSYTPVPGSAPVNSDGSTTPHAAINITVQALHPDAISAATLQQIADGLTPALQQTFGRNGQNVAVLV